MQLEISQRKDIVKSTFKSLLSATGDCDWGRIRPIPDMPPGLLRFATRLANRCMGAVDACSRPLYGRCMGAVGACIRPLHGRCMGAVDAA